MASNIDIQKKCEWCGKLFIAHKTSTRCCSHRCANLAYKERTRQKRVSEFQAMVNQQIEKEDCIDKDFFTPSEAAKYIGISRATFYRYLETNLIKSVQLKRKTIIRKRDIEALLIMLLLTKSICQEASRVSPTSTPLPRLKRNLVLRSRGSMRLRRSIISLAHSVVAEPIGVRSISTPTLPRKLPMRALPSGTAWRSCRRSSV